MSRPVVTRANSAPQATDLHLLGSHADLAAGALNAPARCSLRLSAALLSMVVVAVCFGIYSKDGAQAATWRQSPELTAAISQQPAGNISSQATSSEPENQYGPSFAYLAWDLFLQAMAPANDSLTFETWTEQCQLSTNVTGCPSAESGAAAATAGGHGKVRMLHGSALSRGNKVAGSECSAMTTTPVAGYSPPSNLTKNAIYCEEVFVNPVEAAFVKRFFTTLVDQQTYGNARSGTVNFPGTEQNEFRPTLDSLEVKVDWVPTTSFNPTFACPDPTNRLYTETINGTCYALVAIHITSKVMPNWLWATFEPSSNLTNPNRCDPELYGTCFDPWGTTSSQRYGKGQTVQQSQNLHHAMADAHLSPAFNNYFLTGVQTQFVDNYGSPLHWATRLWSSTRECRPANRRASPVTGTRISMASSRRKGHRKTISGDPRTVGPASAMRATKTKTTIACSWSRLPRRRTFPGYWA